MKNKIIILFVLIITIHQIYSEDIINIFNNGFNFKLGKTIKEIIKQLGEPKQQKVKDIYSPLVKTYLSSRLYTLKYDGIEIRIFKMVDNNNEYISVIGITNNKYKLKFGLRIGMDKESIISILGKNYLDEKKGVLYYQAKNDIDTDGCIRVYYNKNIVYKIEWAYKVYD